MFEETPIVQDTRNIRSDISKHFQHDFNKYIIFLQMQATVNPVRASRDNWCEVAESNEANNQITKAYTVQ